MSILDWFDSDEERREKAEQEAYDAGLEEGEQAAEAQALDEIYDQGYADGLYGLK